MLNKIRAYGIQVTAFGHDWQAADAHARQIADSNKEIGYIHPFDHPAIWKGNSTMIEEIQKQLNGVKPACIATSVGGGGLLVGILKGLERIAWQDVPVLAMETIGTDCFNKSIEAEKIVEIEITSLAKTLGARSVTPELMKMLPDFHVISKILPDENAISACLRFVDDHGFLVELGCGVTLASVYSGLLPNVIEDTGYNHEGPIVLIIRGGSNITPNTLGDFARKFDLPMI